MSLFEDFIEDEENEVSSEADPAPMDVFTHPRGMNLSFGHEDKEKRLLDLFHSGRLPQALIFSGPEGIGKATMAYRFARFLLKEGSGAGQGGLFGEPEKAASLDVAPGDPVFRKVAAGSHPDLLAIERAYDESKGRYKDSVDVESVRKVAPFLRLTASDGLWRVVIIDDADTMNRNAQNAILKILEEPPAHVLLILIVHRSGAIIPTIRSRAQVLHFSTLSQNMLREALDKNGLQLSALQMDFLNLYADGSLGRALQAAEQGVFEVYESILNIWQSWPAWNKLDIHALADDLGSRGRDEAYTLFARLMEWIVATFAGMKARGQTLSEPLAQAPALAAFMAQSSLEELLQICENLRSHFARADAANLDKKQAVIGAFSLIRP